jgi:hypothetical protein
VLFVVYFLVCVVDKEEEEQMPAVVTVFVTVSGGEVTVLYTVTVTGVS